MARQGTLEKTWIGITSGGYPIRVEEHWSNLAYIVEFYDGDELSDGRCLSHCPSSGELLDVALLQVEEEAHETLFA